MVVFRETFGSSLTSFVTTLVVVCIALLQVLWENLSHKEFDRTRKRSGVLLTVQTPH